MLSALADDESLPDDPDEDSDDFDSLEELLVELPALVLFDPERLSVL